MGKFVGIWLKMFKNFHWQHWHVFRNAAIIFDTSIFEIHMNGYEIYLVLKKSTVVKLSSQLAAAGRKKEIKLLSLNSVTQLVWTSTKQESFLKYTGRRTDRHTDKWGEKLHTTTTSTTSTTSSLSHRCICVFVYIYDWVYVLWYLLWTYCTNT